MIVFNVIFVLNSKSEAHTMVRRSRPTIIWQGVQSTRLWIELFEALIQGKRGVFSGYVEIYL